MSVITNWHKFRQLSRAKRWLLFQAFLLLPLTAIALRLFGFRRLHTALPRLTSAKGTPAGNKQQILLQAYGIARTVQMAGQRYPFRITNCLTQSLTLWWLLHHRGIESGLHIGVRKEANQLKAHAWVEYQKHVLNDMTANYSQFSPFHRAIITAKVSSL